GGIDDLDLRPDEMVEQEVALNVVVVGLAAEVEAAFEAEFGAGGRSLPAVVRLHACAPDDYVGFLAQGVGPEELIVPGLVAAEQEPGAIVALEKDADAADPLGETWHLFQGRGQVSQVHARQTRHAPPQFLRRQDRKGHSSLRQEDQHPLDYSGQSITAWR